MATYDAGAKYNWRFARTQADGEFIASCCDSNFTLVDGQKIVPANLGIFLCGSNNFFLNVYNEYFPREERTAEQNQIFAKKHPETQVIGYRDKVNLYTLAWIFSDKETGKDIGWNAKNLYHMNSYKKLQTFGLPEDALNEWYYRIYGGAIASEYRGNRHPVMFTLISTSLLEFNKVHGFPFQLNGEFVEKDIHELEQTDSADTAARTSIMRMSLVNQKGTSPTVVDFLKSILKNPNTDLNGNPRIFLTNMADEMQHLYFIPHLYNAVKSEIKKEYIIYRYPNPTLLKKLHSCPLFLDSSQRDIDWTRLRIDPNTNKMVYALNPERNIKKVLSFHTSNLNWIDNNFV